MELQLINDALDDVPDKVEADGFSGFNAALDPTKLDPATIRPGAENVWADVDLLLQTRPGLKFNTLLTRAALAAAVQTPRGMGYYDVPAREAVLVSGDAKLYEITGDGDNVTSNVLTPLVAPDANGNAFFSQLVDKMFWIDGTAKLSWAYYTGGAWSHGNRSTFNGGGAMPAWGLICAHNFRLLAYDPASDKIYASAVGSAVNDVDWTQTDNIRVGSGEGDPVMYMLSGQNGLLYVIKERSAWVVNTTDASVANWTAQIVTNLAGCRAGRTVVLVGQDVIFLSSFGVVSLGALATTLSISPKTTLSAPVQPYVDRINPAAVDTSWAALWRDQYLLALPLDDSDVPNYILPYNTTTKQWGAPWRCTFPDLLVGDQEVDMVDENGDLLVDEADYELVATGQTIAFAGWVCGITTNFGKTQETLMCDNTGRVVRFDKSAEKDKSDALTTQEIVSYATVKAFDHGLRENWKQPLFAFIDWYNSTGADTQINLVRDGKRAYPDIPLDQCEIVASGLTTNAVQSFPFRFPYQFQPNTNYSRNFTLRQFSRYKNVGLQIVSQKNRLRLRAVRISAFIDSADLQ